MDDEFKINEIEAQKQVIINILKVIGCADIDT